MKKLMVVGLTFVSFAVAQAQNVSLGPVASFNHSWLSGTNGAESQFNPGFKVGATLTYSFNPHWAVGGDVLFANEGAKTTQTVGATKYNTKVNLNYIRVPLKLSYFFGQLGDKLRPRVYAGPSLGFLVGGKSKLETTLNNNVTKTDVASKTNYNGFDLGAMLGAGINYRIGEATWLNLDLNYTHGLLDISKLNTTNANRNLGLAVGVTFPIGTIKK